MIQLKVKLESKANTYPVTLGIGIIKVIVADYVAGSTG